MWKRTAALCIALGICAVVAGAQSVGSVSDTGGDQAALQALVAAERAFARMSVERGVRESFLAYFADDGISFRPGPTRTREDLLKQPAPATRPPVMLDWQPVAAGVSRAGDLGYTTGPSVFTDQSPRAALPQYGYYFSIWKRQADGSWKVAVDLGVPTPAPAADAVAPALRLSPPGPPTKAAARAAANLAAERLALLARERAFARTAAASGLARAYERDADDSVRLQRSGIFPLTSKTDALRHLEGTRIALKRWEPLAADVAQSGDLGYTYGGYTWVGSAQPSATEEQGYYVRVWKRDARGRWRVVVDTLHQVPAEKK